VYFPQNEGAGDGRDILCEGQMEKGHSILVGKLEENCGRDVEYNIKIHLKETECDSAN
jgi:hypothetical protein